MEFLREEIALATNNPHKLREYREMLSPLGYIVLCPKDLGIVCDPEESGRNYRENSLIKARALSEMVKMAVLADDSGLEVESLLGFPGLWSSRFADMFKHYGEAQSSLVRMGKEAGSLRARFACTICYLEKKGARPLYFEGECKGRLLEAPQGRNGFGFDPIFQSDEGPLMFGLATDEEKNRVSHRHDALRKLAVYLAI